MDVKNYLNKESLKHYNQVVFPVEKEPVANLLNISARPVSGISHAVIVRGSQIINFCSEDYYLRKNEDIIQQLGNILLEGGYTFDLRTNRFKSNRFQMEFIVNNISENLGTLRVKDPVAVAIRVYNSYDGSQGFLLDISIYRLVCSNGMVAPEGVLSVKKIHTGQLLDFVDISTNQIIEGLGIAKTQFEDSIQYYYDLMDFKVNPLSLEPFVQEIAEVVKFPNSLVPGVLERIEYESSLGLELSNWLVYSGFNYALNHLNDSLIGRKSRVLDGAVLKFLLG